MKSVKLNDKALSAIRGGHDKDYNLGHNLGMHLRKGADAMATFLERAISIINPFDD